MIGDTPAQEWMRSRPPLPPMIRKRRTYRIVWACMALVALVEILIGALVP